MTIAPERITPADQQGGYMPNLLPGSEAEQAIYDSYRLSDEQLNVLEADVVNDVRAAGYDKQIVTVLVRGDDPRANFGRTNEQRTFDAEGEDYDFGKNYGGYESHSLFLYTVDPEIGAIAHVKRLVMAKTMEEMAESGETGIEMLDDRRNAKDPSEHAEVDELLEQEGTTIEDIAGRTMVVATNLTTHRAPLSIEKPYSLYSYKGTFNVVGVAGAKEVFVYQNKKAIKSLGKLGLDTHLLGGKEYHLPLPLEDPQNTEAYDDSYVALVLPYTPENVAAFHNTESRNPMVAAVGRAAVPVLVFDKSV